MIYLRCKEPRGSKSDKEETPMQNFEEPQQYIVCHSEIDGIARISSTAADS